MMMSESAPDGACIETSVRSKDNAISGIVFRYLDPHRCIESHGVSRVSHVDPLGQPQV